MTLLKSLTIASLMATSTLAGAAFADSHGEALTGDLKIFLDTSNPAPRATMEAMIADFQKMHPDLNIATTVIDREAYKTQIRNFLTADAPDVATWYAANRMKPYVDAGLFEDVSDLWAEPEIGEQLASTKGAMTIELQAAGLTTSTCAPTGSSITCNLPEARSAGPTTRSARPLQTGKS